VHKINRLSTELSCNGNSSFIPHDQMFSGSWTETEKYSLHKQPYGTFPRYVSSLLSQNSTHSGNVEVHDSLHLEPFRFHYLSFTDFPMPEQHFQNCSPETSSFQHTSLHAETVHDCTIGSS